MFHILSKNSQIRIRVFGVAQHSMFQMNSKFAAPYNPLYQRILKRQPIRKQFSGWLCDFLWCIVVFEVNRDMFVFCC